MLNVLPFFCKSVFEILPHIDFIPDVIHSHDWHTALVPIYASLKYKKLPEYENIKTIFTIHNIQYQGVFGKEILNLSSFKIVLHLEEDEAFTVQKHLSLSDEETMQIIRAGRGEALLCANKNKVCVDIKASPLMYDLITTKRTDLEKRRKT